MPPLTGHGRLLPDRLPFILFGGIVAAHLLFSSDKGGRPILLLGSLLFAELAPFARLGGRSRLNLLGILCAFPLVSCLFHQPNRETFYFEGRARFTALSSDPNVFGGLVALGLVITLGICVSNSHRWLNGRQSGASTKEYLSALIAPLCCVLLGLILLLTYSRGSWLAALVGSVAIVRDYNTVSRRSQVFWPRIALWGLGLLISLTPFWLVFRDHDGSLFAERLFSLFDPNDFSARNRYAAWMAACSLLADNPFFGVGWSDYMPLLQGFYSSPLVNTSTAVNSSDLLILGVTMGIPCATAFLWCLASAIINNRSRVMFGGQGADVEEINFLLCSAGSMTLFVASMFSGIILTFPLGPIFWVLLRLARISRDNTVSSNGGHETSVRGSTVS